MSLSGSERVYVNGLLKEEKITITPSTTMLVKLHSSPLYDKLEMNCNRIPILR
jgi:rRNA pseudouridine-1189 N-methylase Emg1 (Nep1/Mra1 family)